MWARSKSISSKQVCETISRIAFRTVLKGYLAHKKLPPSLL